MAKCMPCDAAAKLKAAAQKAKRDGGSGAAARTFPPEARERILAKGEAEMSAKVETHVMAAIKLPQTVILPKHVARAAGIKRTLTLNRRTLELHPSVISYLRNDPQHKHLLQAESTDLPTVISPDPAAVAARTVRPTAHSLTERTPDSANAPVSNAGAKLPAAAAIADADEDGQSANGDPLDEDGSEDDDEEITDALPDVGDGQWAEWQTLVVLREYAKTQKVELTSADNRKPLVVAKIRAALEEFEVKRPGTEMPPEG